MSSINPNGARAALRWLNEAWKEPEAALAENPHFSWPQTAHQRLVRALSQANAGELLSPIDLMALLRPVVRAESGHLAEHGQTLTVPYPACGALSQEGCPDHL